MAHAAADQVEDEIVVVKLCGKIGPAIVDDGIGAEGADEIDILGAGGGGDNGAQMLGELHGDGADAAGPGVNEHALAACELADGHQTRVSAQARNRQRARFDIAKV